MKKVVTVLVLIFCTIVFTSCTNQTNEALELIEYETYSIDKRKVTSPNGGSTGDPDYDEE